MPRISLFRHLARFSTRPFLQPWSPSRLPSSPTHFLCFPHHSPIPPSSSATELYSPQTFSSPDLSFLNDLIPGFDSTTTSATDSGGIHGISPPNPFYPHTSPTSTLPVNWGPPASMPQPAPSIPQIANLPKSTLLTRRVGKGKEGATVDPASLNGTPVTALPPRLAQIEGFLQ